MIEKVSPSKKINLNSDSWLTFDYLELYNPKNKYSKYFLPAFFTKLWISVILSVFLQNHLLYLFGVLCFLNILTICLSIIVRPFIFMLSNIRIIFIELLFTATNGLMIYFAILSNSSEYSI